MRIVEVRERTVPMAAPMSNAFVSFARMTASTVAIVSDVVRDGEPLVGFGFNSNGRYAQGGLMRERFIPRLLEADPEDLVDESGGNLDPQRVWAVLMRDEKPGGHGDRSVAVGVLDMAIWDLRPRSRASRCTASSRGGTATGGPTSASGRTPRAATTAPGRTSPRSSAEMRGYLERGYTKVKLKIGGASLADDLRRIEAVAEIVDTAADRRRRNGRFDLATALEYGRALGPRAALVRGGGRPARLPPPGDARGRVRAAAGDRREPVLPQDARNLLRYGGCARTATSSSSTPRSATG